jgi:hypothetical protein
VTRRGGVATSVEGETAPGRGKGGDDAVGLTRILLGQKIKKIHASIQLLQMDSEDLKRR